MLENAADLRVASLEHIAEFNAFCEAHHLKDKVQADHICVRCSSNEKYEYQKGLFTYTSRFIYESIISQRCISVIGLNESLETIVGPINYLELSDQKLDGSQIDQIDHIEIVPTTISYDVLVIELQKHGVTIIETVRPHHTTHDIKLSLGFMVKLSRKMLVDKIKEEEMI